MSTAASQGLPASVPPVPGQGWFRNIRDLPREHGFEPLRVEGRIPPDLAGTLYRNGASLFSNFGRPYRHWFDGDGALTAIRLTPRGAEGAVRVIESAGLLAERAAGKPLFGGYGTRVPGFLGLLRGRFKNVANTSVIVWNNHLLALNEPAKPTELDPRTLATMGETDLGGAIPRAFSAHPHHVRERGAAYNFGVRYGRRTELDLFELPDAGPARRMATLTLAGASMIHDFIATPNYLIFFAPPLRLRVLRLLLGIASYSDSLAWRPEVGTEVIVVPIDQPGDARRFTVEPFFQWHFSNAFERGREIIVDFVRHADFNTNKWLGNVMTGDPGMEVDGHYGRATLDPGRGALKYEERWDVSCEFPRVGSSVVGQPHRFAYLNAHSTPERSRQGLFDEVIRLDVESGRAERVTLGPEQYPSEPLFVPAKDADGEDDGYLLTLVYDGVSDTSHLAILDARSLGRGALARVHFDHAIPFTFHGFWQG